MKYIIKHFKHMIYVLKTEIMDDGEFISYLLMTDEAHSVSQAMSRSSTFVTGQKKVPISSTSDICTVK
jgi:hypothetical protein